MPSSSPAVTENNRSGHASDRLAPGRRPACGRAHGYGSAVSDASPAPDPSAAAARIAAGYATDGPAIELGSVVLGGGPHPEAQVRVPLAMLNRHGLIAGATGTGKTKTLQLIAEQLSAAGVPVVLADLKGDLAGLGAARRGRRPHHPARHRHR